MAKKIKLGIIGAGGMSTNIHTPGIAEIEDCEIVAVCDLFEEKAQNLAKKFNIPKVYTLHHEMLANEEMDGVVVLVNPERTFWVVNDCLKAGFNVITEKPAGICAHQAHSLARLAEEKGLICAVAMNRRHNPLLQVVLNKMKAATEITEVDGRFMKFSDLTKAWTYASAYLCDIIHCVDVVRYCAGSEPKKVATVVKTFNGPVDNAWSSIIEFENGVIGNIRANYQAGARFHDLEIHGPGASAYINLGFGDTKCNAKIFYNAGGSMYSAASVGVSGPSVEEFDAVEIAGREEYSHYYGYKAENQDFVDCIREGKKPLCSIEDAAKSMDMAEMLLKETINR